MKARNFGPRVFHLERQGRWRGAGLYNMESELRAFSARCLKVGMEVILSGHPNVYPPSGRLSFVADTVELVGGGCAQKSVRCAGKNKLEAEELFAPERKRPLPEFVRHIGVVTSLKGAVIHDFENNLGKFGFRVISVCDSRVEGQQAVKPLLPSRLYETPARGRI